MQSLYEPYAHAVAGEIYEFKSRISHPLSTILKAETIYFGGGTPSLLPLPLLAEILAACRASFEVPPNAEISLEANPETISAAYLEGLHNLGVNRLSLGVQSAHQSELVFLRRRHTFADAVQSVRLARVAGFDNVNIDLIYGVPGQTMTAWQETVARALEMQPEHISMYCLTVEERTTLAVWIRRGAVPAPDDDLAADMVLWADECLAAAGLMRYEISNWARPGFHCRHNLTYWRNAPYLGFGAGAHSSFDGRRFANIAHPRQYIQCISDGNSPVAESEEISPELEMDETMMLGLRLVEGVSSTRFEARFGVTIAQVYGGELEKLGRQGLIEVDEQGVRLTRRGWLLGNRVFAAFLRGKANQRASRRRQLTETISAAPGRS